MEFNISPGLRSDEKSQSALTRIDKSTADTHLQSSRLHGYEILNWFFSENIFRHDQGGEKQASTDSMGDGKEEDVRSEILSPTCMIG